MEAPEDQPVTIEFRAHLPAGTHLIRIVNAVPGPNPEERASRPLGSKPFFTMKARQPWQIKLTDDDFKPLWPTLLVDYIEWEGPVQQSWPPPAHQQIFFAGHRRKKTPPTPGRSSPALPRGLFGGRSGRMKWTGSIKLFENSQQLGDDFENSVKTGLLAVLCSDNFIYLIEGSANSPSPQLNDWELASRLSYFLWSTMPDQRLMDLAQQGTLHQPAGPDRGSSADDAGPAGRGLCRFISAAVAPTSPSGDVRAGSEALPRLR